MSLFNLVGGSGAAVVDLLGVQHRAFENLGRECAVRQATEISAQSKKIQQEPMLIGISACKYVHAL